MTKTTTPSIPYEVEQVMAIYNINNSSGTLEGLIAVLENLQSEIPQEHRQEDAMLLEAVNYALELLRGMTQEAFEALDLVVDFPAVEI